MEVGVARTLSYLQCIHLIQDQLNQMPHGGIIKWCEEHGLTYNTVLSLKTNRLSFFAPNLVADVLRALGYEVWVTKSISKRKDKINEKKDKEARKKETLYIVKKLPESDSNKEQTSASGPSGH
jgi:hypothetical protein